MYLSETKSIVSWKLPRQIVFIDKIATLALCVSYFCFCCSVAQSCLILLSHGLQPPGLPVHHHLPEFAQVHVHCTVMPSSHLIFWHPLLLLPSMFPRIRDFSNESAIQIRWPKYWSFSFSISPSNEYSVFPLRLTALISLLSKGLSGVFSSTTAWRHQFTGALPSLGSALTTVRDHWEDHSLDYMDLRQQSDVCTFNTLSRFIILSYQEAIVFWFHGCSRHP